VTNLENGRSVNVEVNDRGPGARSRSLDLSPAAAQKIKLSDRGVARVKITPVRKSLSESDLLKLLAGGVYSGRIAALVRERGINFKPTNRDLELLRRAGADSELERAITAARVDASQIATRP
jgi:rare lipoprotein A (peptidoglycan hydrolase)